MLKKDSVIRVVERIKDREVRNSFGNRRKLLEGALKYFEVGQTHGEDGVNGKGRFKLWGYF